MSKRQRFFVELRQDDVTVVSWKKLVADGERMAMSKTAAAPSTKSPLNVVLGLRRATSPRNLKMMESNPPPKPKLKLKLSGPNPTPNSAANPVAEPKRSLDERSWITYTSRQALKSSIPIVQNSNEKRILDDAKFVEAKPSAEPLHGHSRKAMAETAGPNCKGKRHQSMPGKKTSCRAKKKTQACVCCSSNTDPAKSQT